MLEHWRRKSEQKKDALARVLETLGSLGKSVESLNESLENNEANTQKALRRIALAQKQQSEQLDVLADKTTTFKDCLVKSYGVSVNYESMLHTLDNLNKIETAAMNASQSRSLLVQLVAQASQDLLALFELVPVSRLGSPYPERGCAVMGAIEQPKWPPGTVIEILQQGYQTQQGSLIREAKVIVSKCVTSEPSITTESEELDYVD